MRLLIRAEISPLHGSGQRQRLPEAQVEPIAGNGVDASGRVTDQCYSAAINSFQLTCHRDGPALCSEA